MDAALVKAIGDKAVANFHRFESEPATRALRRFEASSDAAEQQRLGRELARIYVETAPSLPLFASPLWGVFNTGRISGFPEPLQPLRGLVAGRPLGQSAGARGCEAALSCLAHVGTKTQNP